MKKFLALFISILTILVACLSGCTATDKALQFNNLAISGEGLQLLDAYRVEKHTYNVKYNAEYNNKMKIDDYMAQAPVSINKEKFGGKYEVEITSALLNDEFLTNNPELKDNGIVKSKKNQTVYVYTYQTKLTLNVQYDFDDQTIKGDFVDTIETKTFFLDEKSNYAPLFSKTEYDCHQLIYSEGNFSMGNLKYRSQIEYGTNVYNSKIEYFDEQGKVADTKSNQAEYTFSKCYDNNQLLFIIRNISIASDSYDVIPFASTAYNEPTELRFDDKGKTVFAPGFNISLLDNSSLSTGKDISVNRYDYYINELKMTGIPQEIYIQREKVGEVQNRAYLVKYVAPLVSAGTTNIKLGALEYILTDVSITNK